MPQIRGQGMTQSLLLSVSLQTRSGSKLADEITKLLQPYDAEVQNLLMEPEGQPQHRANMRIYAKKGSIESIRQTLSCLDPEVKVSEYRFPSLKLPFRESHHYVNVVNIETAPSSEPITKTERLLASRGFSVFSKQYTPDPGGGSALSSLRVIVPFESQSKWEECKATLLAGNPPGWSLTFETQAPPHQPERPEAAYGSYR